MKTWEAGESLSNTALSQHVGGPEPPNPSVVEQSVRVTLSSSKTTGQANKTKRRMLTNPLRFFGKSQVSYL